MVEHWLRLTALVALGTTLTACGSSSSRQGTADTSHAVTASSGGSGADLTGAGATFPYPIYSRWFSEYASKAGVKINYQPIGSGGGIKQFRSRRWTSARPTRR